MSRIVLLSALLLLPFLNTACEPGLAWGDPQAVLVVGPEEWWPTLEDSVYTVLSPTVWTVREDHTFRVTYRSPDDPNNWWRFRELVLFGSGEESWLQEALDALPRGVEPTAPGLYEAADIWAKGQRVQIILVDPNQPVEPQVFSRISRVHETVLDRFLAGATARMFQSGRDSALLDTLSMTAGFSLLLPEVYDWGVEDSVYIFRNDNPDPAELIRHFTVAWLSPEPAEFPDSDALLDWRKAIAEAYWPYAQVVDRENLRTHPLPSTLLEGAEYRGTWSNPPGSPWPAAGAFITRGISCPHQDRYYLVDGWLYAPGKDKWEYMLQMDTIMNSFRCGTQGL